MYSARPTYSTWLTTPCALLRRAPRYRVETIPFHWDSDFGPELSDGEASLKNFAFPFSGKTWSSFSVGVTGSITFGEGPSSNTQSCRGGSRPDRRPLRRPLSPNWSRPGRRSSIRFRPSASSSSRACPATRYLKESGDRAVVTWSLTEPVGGIQDMTWTPTVNRFQAVLHKDGAIEFNYDDIHAEDAIVGVYPMVLTGNETEIATVSSR